MSRRPRQIAHKVQATAANTSAAATGEASPGIDTHVQATSESGAAFSSANGVAESVSSPTNQAQAITKTGNAFTSS